MIRVLTVGIIVMLGVLTVIFVSLKLSGVIYWSWLWVLSPLLALYALAITALVVATLIIVMTDAINEHRVKRR